MTIDLRTLPTNILEQIPLSIRTFQSVYTVEDLPSRIQELIKQYLDATPIVKYSNVFDFKPEISKYSDFQTINNKVDLVIEYLKNYLLVLPESYPFDPIFGCSLKYHLQTRDTNLRQTLISAEIDKVVNILSLQFNVPIIVKSVIMNPVSGTVYSEFNIKIDLQIGEYYKSINVEFT